jgi:hypothetical protein
MVLDAGYGVGCVEAKPEVVSALHASYRRLRRHLLPRRRDSSHVLVDDAEQQALWVGLAVHENDSSEGDTDDASNDAHHGPDPPVVLVVLPALHEDLAERVRRAADDEPGDEAGDERAGDVRPERPSEWGVANAYPLSIRSLREAHSRRT